jgi:hypothetical protein
VSETTGYTGNVGKGNAILTRKGQMPLFMDVHKHIEGLVNVKEGL